ncbi:carbohydrate ABC transporter substrate-binding protein, CUT1 family [Rhizobiales bacterium GAS113]|jgi:raffinose/stachyose/melibiose transport system substrate-binding protein|nr:carbohydrate ABC transporter substrate-binding protein, CUT1 family [Rhizobiales bacterium GAS113]SED27662.1 carbohydrate ABC transporter substrate-binding protein, CUT1 family [Rhizobiales bacterium GAS188]
MGQLRRSALHAHSRLRRALLAAAVAATGLLGGGAAALADTTVKWLYIETNPEIIQYWKDIIGKFEQAHPGVKVETQFLENEAYKAKLPTLLQSSNPPHIFYSWAGGVLHAQVDSGVLKDITAEMGKGWGETYNPAALKAFTYKDKVWGVPNNLSEVDFYYNKKLFQKAGIDATKIGNWSDLLGAVKALKGAGITPIAVGGADKWPVHFYWVYLAIRQGGLPAFQDAIAGKNGGFAGQNFIKAGEAFKQLVDLQPFQPGFLAAKWPAFLGAFGDGRAAMVLSFSATTPKLQRLNAADQKGIALEDLGLMHFPALEGGAGKPTDTMGGINGWLISKNAPPEAVEFLRFLTNAENQRELAARNLQIPAQKDAPQAVTDPLLKIAAQSLAASTYHQNFYDQDLGPAIGRVVNDATTDLASGATTPVAAAQQIQDAWALEH